MDRDDAVGEPFERAFAEGRLPGPPGGQAVGFLLSQFGTVVAHQFRDLIEKTGLDPREFALLRVIAVFDGPTQHTVGEALEIPASSLVGVIDHLESGGLVERRTSPLDRRARTLHLTDDGRRALAAAVELAMAYEGHLCSDLSATERASLLELLSRVGVHLHMTPHSRTA